MMNMDVKPALALPDGLEVTGIEMIDEVLTLTTASIQGGLACPLCGTLASRVHSHYTRQLGDVPTGGQAVHLVLEVRKFFCDATSCPRKIFTERLPSFVEPWARTTTRLSKLVTAIGLATGGMLGARLADRLGIQTSWMTILRRIMALPTHDTGQVTQLGVDDFSFRRGRKFGTILVDMQSRKVIDVLPDRTAETVASWLRDHPEITLVSRDRGTDYAQAARVAAPQAIQIADRFHLCKNLSELAERVLARCRTEIRQASTSEQQGKVNEEVKAEDEEWRPRYSQSAEQIPVTHHAERYDRYQQILALKELHCTNKQIAQQLGMAERTVRHWIQHGISEEVKPYQKQDSCFDPYASTVLRLWDEGRNGLQIFEEIRAQGYRGSSRTVHRYLAALQRKRPLLSEIPTTPLQKFRSREAVWWFFRDPEKLNKEDQEELTYLLQVSKTAKTLYDLVREFLRMVHHLNGEQLDAWLEKVSASQIEELQQIVRSIQKDKDAVYAGLTHSCNNGLVEGKVNKLKLLKRMMFGRAGFALLRKRVLHAL
jgi:transposase